MTLDLTSTLNLTNSKVQRFSSYKTSFLLIFSVSDPTENLDYAAVKCAKCFWDRLLGWTVRQSGKIVRHTFIYFTLVAVK
jgi:hypothetical protein